MNANGRRLLGLGGGLVLLVNAVALGGAAWNRSGDPDATVVLSQRELALPWQWGDAHDDSGLALQLRWRVPSRPAGEDDIVLHDGAYAHADWLDADKLAALGFEHPAEPHEPARPRTLSREVWLALELDGAAYAAALRHAEAVAAAADAALAAAPDDRQRQERARTAREALQRARDEDSRLFVVDADLDAAALRERWPDRGAHIVTLGRVRPEMSLQHGGKPGQWRWSGRVEAISIDRIHVPLAHRASLEPALALPWPRAAARYAVTLPYGRRHEPWIEAVSPGTGD